MADEAPSAHSTRWLETSRGILRYSELAPWLAERVLRIQERIEAGDYGRVSIAGHFGIRNEAGCLTPASNVAQSRPCFWARLAR